MNHWNWIGITKAVLLGSIFFYSISNPFDVHLGNRFIRTYVIVVAGIIAFPFIIRMSASIFRQVLEEPYWNDNPLNFIKPLRFFHFAAYFLLTCGSGLVVGTVWKYQSINTLGMAVISYGIGILLSISGLVGKLEKKDQ